MPTGTSGQRDQGMINPGGQEVRGQGHTAHKNDTYARPSNLTTLALCDLDLWPTYPNTNRFIPLPCGPLLPVCSKSVRSCSKLQDWWQTNGWTDKEWTNFSGTCSNFLLRPL